MQWHKAVIDRQVADYCTLLQSKPEPWYDLTSNFKQKGCPFEAGHIESFEQVEIGKNTGFIPITMIGKYRIAFKSFFTDENGSEVIDCARLGFDILEG